MLRLQDYRLIAFDMDSTLITMESVDELATQASRRAQIQAITEATMRGDITDFMQSLRQRVALLAGLPQEAINDVIQHHLRLTPGAQQLVAACQARGLRCMLITGGFTCFAETVAVLLGLHEVRANVLEISSGQVTGRLLTQPGRALVDSQEKQRSLLRACTEMGIAPTQAIAVGDGANDLPMLQAAGLSVAYRAKPVLRAVAQVAIDEGGLDRLLEVFQAPVERA